MKGQNKRQGTTYVPSPTSKQVLQKKTDLKNTPNKTILEGNGQLQQENQVERNKQKNSDHYAGRLVYGSERWCAAKQQCLNKNEPATSKKNVRIASESHIYNVLVT
jgi:hypothetical protein